MAGSDLVATNGTTESNGTYSHGVKVEDTKIVVVMVGLPARGKSLIAQKSKFSYYISITTVYKLAVSDASPSAYIC